MPISSVFQVVSEDPEQIESLVTTLNGYVTTTAASEAAAATSEANAASSETNAATSAASALVSKNAAASSAASANSDATAAAASAVTSQTAATSSSANAASTSADATQTAADRVQTGLDRTATNADAVQTAADRVQTGLDVTSSSASAAAALSSRNAAGTSETNAAASAASSSADATATAADRVQTGLDRTATNADAIATAADRVQTGLDATASANSASAASTSATAAAASQVSAASSAASAAAVFNDFEDRYYGPHASDSAAQTYIVGQGLTVDQGDLYFNSTANEMRVYDGGSWIAASSAGGASLLNYNYTATAAQTAFTGAADNSNTLSYTVDNLIVTRNGVVLEDGTDYTATDGSTITLSVAAAAGDEINVVAFKSFTTADMVSATSGGAFQGNVDFAAGIDVTGNITVTGTVDGRDVATDGTKLDGIEALADVTDTANVTAAGAAMLTGANFTGNVDVTGTVQGDALVIDGNSVFNGNATIDQGALGGNTLSLDRTGADGTLGFLNSGTQTGLISGASGGGINAYVGAVPSLAMAIDANKNVGIGGIPNKLFHVRDDDSFTGGSRIVAALSPSITNTQSAGLAFGTYADDDYWKQGIFWTRTNSYGVGDLHFANRGTTDTTTVSAADAKMTITSAGAVGIGTASPIAQSKLTVAGHSLSLTGSDANFGAGGVRGMLDLAGGYLRMGAVNGGGSASGVKLLSPAGAEALVVDSSGNVGIGTTLTPHDASLTVHDDIKLNAPTPSKQRIYSLYAGTAPYSLGSSGGAAVVFDRLADSSDELAFETHYAGNSHSEKMRINKEGRVTMPYQPAFRAVLITSTNTVGNYLVFETVDYNIGNHYNSSTGVFTAPISGRYMVSVQGFNENNQNSQLYVQVNNVNKSYSLSYAGASGSNQYNMMSQSSIFNLAANDTVRVICNAGELYAASVDSNSFSCYLLG